MEPQLPDEVQDFLREARADGLIEAHAVERAWLKWRQSQSSETLAAVLLMVSERVNEQRELRELLLEATARLRAK